MSNITVKAEGGALAPLVSRDELIATLRESHYPGAKTESIALVLGYCSAAGLDPMDKPVHIVPMAVPTGQKDADGWDITEMRDIVMPGIGLYRTKAQRTGQYAGQSEPVFGPDVTEKLGDVSITYPAWCQVTVYRLVPGLLQPVAYTATERWKENYATKGRRSTQPNAMWTKRPYAQLAKCAEAQALRKGFPDAVGSAPTADEMEGKALDGEHVDQEAGAPRGSSLMPQPKQAPAPATNARPAPAEDIPFTEKAAAPAPSQAPSGDQPTISANEAAYLGNKAKAAGVEMESLLQRFGVSTALQLTRDQFAILKSELLQVA